ncbi:acetyltransferase [Azotosporobacter soli]|uniref:acetyltransferase n=1 Tax=Azotosporobacter soli TaxID=3055040 RepID=UPI0031FE8935
MDKPVIVVGAGGHAKVVIAALQKQGATILGILEAAVDKKKDSILGVAVIGDDDAVLRYEKEAILLVNGIGSIGSTQLRRNVFLKFKKWGYHFMVLIHPAAIVADDVALKEGSQVMAGAVIETGTVIGVNAIVNTGATVNHDCLVEAHAHIAPGVTLCGGVTIDEGAHIGAGSTLIQGMKIGKEAVVGAGALVIKPVKEKQVVYGNPAKEVKKI